MLSLAGLVYVFLAEDFCSGVPVSRVVNDEIVLVSHLRRCRSSTPRWPAARQRREAVSTRMRSTLPSRVMLGQYTDQLDVSRSLCNVHVIVCPG